MQPKFAAVSDEVAATLPPRTAADDVPPTAARKDKALRKLHDNRATGMDGVFIELFKYTKFTCTRTLIFDIIDRCRVEETLPAEMLVGEFVFLSKLTIC